MTDNNTYKAYKGDLMRYIEHRTQTDPAFAIERLQSAEAHLEADRQREATLAVALAQAQKERDNAATTCKEAQTDCRRLREVLTVVNAKNTNDECHPYHAWEPGGDNHLETLSCPVLIPAQWLRDLIGEGGREAQAERNALVEKLTTAHEALMDVLSLIDVERLPNDDTHAFARGKGALDFGHNLSKWLAERYPALPPQQKGE